MGEKKKIYKIVNLAEREETHDLSSQKKKRKKKKKGKIVNNKINSFKCFDNVFIPPNLFTSFVFFPPSGRKKKQKKIENKQWNSELGIST